MPRSFLVKKPSGTRIPNYGQLDACAHDLNGSWDCGGLLVPACHHPPAPLAPPHLQDHSRLLSRFSAPLSPDAKAPPIPMGSRSPGTPLKDTQTLNLPPRRGAHRRSFSCRHCARAYASLGALKMHLRTHTLPCLCRLCGKAFSRPWLLQGHIRTHTALRLPPLQPGFCRPLQPPCPPPDPLGRQEVPVPCLRQDLLPNVTARPA
ncbi:zinc finger protein SNAI3 isoform 2-T2 [Pluvialis apricaria]